MEAQEKALGEWRAQADLDYVQTQRLYYALEDAAKHIDAYGGSVENVFADNPILSVIDEALAGVRLVPPKVFK